MFERLTKNIIDVMKEEQIKLGYQSETVRLYYPLQSLNRFLRMEFSQEEMLSLLQEKFCSQVREMFGDIDITAKKERFCFRMPPQAAEYVHTHMGETEFIRDLIETVRHHGCTLEDVFAQFHKHSSQVHIEKMNNGEFDYLVYFENDEPDDFRYCITDEGAHVIFHRYTKEDYVDFAF